MTKQIYGPKGNRNFPTEVWVPVTRDNNFLCMSFKHVKKCIFSSDSMGSHLFVRKMSSADKSMTGDSPNIVEMSSASKRHVTFIHVNLHSVANKSIILCRVFGADILKIKVGRMCPSWLGKYFKLTAKQWTWTTSRPLLCGIDQKSIIPVSPFE